MDPQVVLIDLEEEFDFTTPTPQPPQTIYTYYNKLEDEMECKVKILDCQLEGIANERWELFTSEQMTMTLEGEEEEAYVKLQLFVWGGGDLNNQPPQGIKEVAATFNLYLEPQHFGFPLWYAAYFKNYNPPEIHKIKCKLLIPKNSSLGIVLTTNTENPQTRRHVRG